MAPHRPPGFQHLVHELEAPRSGEFWQRLADREAKHVTAADELAEFLVHELEDMIATGEVGDRDRQARQHVPHADQFGAAIALTRK